MNAPLRIRQECPPGACICEREQLLNDPQSDLRILRLTREEEARLVARLENLADYADLQRMQERMYVQLGIVVQITPSAYGVRTVRGLNIQVAAQPGLCRKTRQAIPTALRRCFENKPQIIYDLLDAQGLFGAE